MQRKILFAIAFTAGTLVFITPHVKTNVNGAPGPYTNAPMATGKELNCLTAGCHIGNPVNASGGALAIKLMDGANEVNEWVAGKQYNVNVTLSKDGASKYGFEISAKQGTGAMNFGTLTPGTTTTFAPLTDSKYITHSSAGGGNWNFTWTAPAAGSDPVTFYVAGNAANGDNTTNGDFIYTTSKTIAASTASLDANERFASHVKVLQNPVDQNLTVNFTQQSPENASIKIYNLQGQEINLSSTLQGHGVHKRFVVETGSLDQGIYIFSIQSGRRQASGKFLRQ